MMNTLHPSFTALGAILLPYPVRSLTGEVYEVFPPTIRQRVEVGSQLLAAARGEQQDIEDLFTLLFDWLPEGLVLDLLLGDAVMLFQTVAELLDGHLKRGIEDLKPPKVEDPKKKNPEPPDDPSDFDPRVAIWDYCQVVGGSDPWRVYDETPWPYFVALTLVREMASARHLLRMAEIEILPHTGKEAQKGIESLRQRAGVKNAGSSGDGHGLRAPPEVIAADRAALRTKFGAPPLKKDGGS